MRKKVEFKKYLLAFAITAMVFFGALYVSNRFADKRLAEIRSIENKISLDLLASETQFALLRESSCKLIDHSTAFSEELNDLANKLSYMENSLGVEDLQVIDLKKYYSLLQVKDYLLVEQVRTKCGIKPITVIYFYSNKGECEECIKEGYVLTKLREEYPELRIYSFDYDLDLSVIKTMKSIHNLSGPLPVLVIADEPHYGFQSTEDVEKLIPQLKKLREAREKAAQKKTTATSTKQ